MTCSVPYGCVISKKASAAWDGLIYCADFHSLPLGMVVPLLIMLIGTLWGFFIHANLRWRFGWLELLVSTLAFHQWHHTNRRARQQKLRLDAAGDG
jgi:sterol desaturase/sphingolipid hydroxylase (fatty acid hydroxylase superfamily)